MKISKQDRFAIVVSVLLTLITMGTGLFVVIPYWCYRFYKNDISFLKIEEDYNTIDQPLVKLSSQNRYIMKRIGYYIIMFIIFIIGFAIAAAILD